MARIRRVPLIRLSRTSVERRDSLMRQLLNYQMNAGHDIFDHIIAVNAMIQALIWLGSLIHHRERYMALRSTLPLIWQGMLDDSWTWVAERRIGFPYNATIRHFVTAYIRHGARRTSILSVSNGLRRRRGAPVPYPWISRIEPTLPEEFIDSFPKTMIEFDTVTGQIMYFRY